MAYLHHSSYHNPNPYIPQSLSEIYDLLGSMWLSAPTFVDQTGAFPEHDVNQRFEVLTQSFGIVRKKLGEERYARLVELAGQAKALFAADPGDDNGKADEGRKLLAEIEDLIQEVRSRRVKAKLEDDDGEISGD